MSVIDPSGGLVRYGVMVQIGGTVTNIGRIVYESNILQDENTDSKGLSDQEAWNGYENR